MSKASKTRWRQRRKIQASIIRQWSKRSDAILSEWASDTSPPILHPPDGSPIPTFADLSSDLGEVREITVMKGVTPGPTTLLEIPDEVLNGKEWSASKAAYDATAVERGILEQGRAKQRDRVAASLFEEFKTKENL